MTNQKAVLLIAKQVTSPGHPAGGPLLERKELSDHLEKLNYPKTSLNLFKMCGTPLNTFVLSSCEHKKFHGEKCHLEYKHNEEIPISVRCNKHYCPKCAPRRTQRLKNRLFSFFKDNLNTTYLQWRFLTISPKNLDLSLNESINDVRKSFKRFLKRQYIKERVQGGVYCLEITNLNGSFHVHLHLLLYSRYLDNAYRFTCPKCKQNYFKKDNLTKKFYCGNRKCDYIHDSELSSRLTDECSESFNRQVYLNISSCLSPIKACSYITKYMTSESTSFYNLDVYAQTIVAMHNKRALLFFGKFYGRKLTKRIYYHCKCCHSLIIYKYDSYINDNYLKLLFSTPPPKKRQRWQ